MSKVISIKVPDETYFRLKDEDKTFREIIEPLLDSYLNSKEKPQYTDGIRAEKPKTRVDEYHKTREEVDALLKRLNRFNEKKGVSE